MIKFDYEELQKKYNTLLNDHKSAKEIQIKLDEFNVKYEIDIKKTREEYDTKINSFKKDYEFQISKLNENNKNNVVKIKDDIIKKENENKRLLIKIEELEKVNKESDSQLEKKSQIISNLKEVCENYLKQIKTQENNLLKLQGNKSDDTKIFFPSSITDDDIISSENKIKASLNEHAFTKTILNDYFLCLFLFGNGITFQNIASDVLSNLSLYSNQIFKEENCSLSFQTELIEDICFIAYDKYMLKRNNNDYAQIIKNDENLDNYSLSYEDFDKNTIKEICNQVLKNNLISKYKPEKKIEQVAKVFINKYTKIFDFETNFEDYFNKEIMEDVNNKANKQKTNQIEYLVTLVEMILHNLKNGKILVDGKELYSFEEYYKGYKNISIENNKLIVNNLIENYQEIDNIIQKIKQIEDINDLSLNGCFNKENIRYILKIFSCIFFNRPKLQKLNLSGNNINGEKISNYVLSYIQQLKFLTYLDLSNNNMTDEDCKFLGEFIKINTSIQTLNLSDNNIGSNGGFYLTNGLIKNKTLKKLYLKNNSINDTGLDSVLNILIQNESGLTDLSLNNNKLTQNNFSTLSVFIKVCKNLEYLDLSSNTFDEESAGLFGVSLAKCGLKILKLSNCNLTENTLNLLLSYVGQSNLVSLELDNNPLGEKEIKSIFNHLKLAKSLKELSLKDCKITGKLFNILANSMTDLINLGIVHLEGNSPKGELKEFSNLIKTKEIIKVFLSKNHLNKKDEDIIQDNFNFIVL